MAVAEASGASALTCRTGTAVDSFNDHLKTGERTLSKHFKKSSLNRSDDVS